MPLSEMLLAEFDQEMANTRKLLECVPDGKMDYQPHPKSMTLGRLASHVAELPGWASATIRQDVLEMSADYQPTIAQTREELLRIFDSATAAARADIAGVSDEHLRQNWQLKFGGQTVISSPRLAVLRGAVMNHLIHHRAQLGVYLRLNDIAIPGMYGPSADDPNPFAANQAQRA